MDIYDPINEKSLESLTLYITIDEAKELYDDLAKLIADPIGNHTHINSSDYKKELTVCIYDPENMNLFNKATKNLLQKTE